jgi:hypothetical protein
MLTLVSHYVSLRSIRKNDEAAAHTVCQISLPHQPTWKSLVPACVAQNHNMKLSFTNLHRDLNHCLNVILCDTWRRSTLLLLQNYLLTLTNINIPPTTQFKGGHAVP